MIRALRARNFSKRPSENTPPAKKSTTPKGIRRNRTRKTKKNITAAKFDAEQAKKKAQKSSLPVRFNVVFYGDNADVEMQDAPSTSQPTIVPVMLPRALNQPPVCEPSDEAIAAATGSSYCGQPAAFVRDELESSGPRSLQTLCSVVTQVDSAVLPKELAVVVNDLTATDYPTHMLAVYAPVPKKPENAPASWVPPRTDVKMYPVHSLFMAAHCAKLGAFPPSPITAVESFPASDEPRTVTLPVRPLCLPSPSTFPSLLHYFYLRRSEVLFKAFLPCDFSTDFVENCMNEEEIMSLATHIGKTFNPNVILKHAKVIHGVWQNACALGAFDDGLWMAIDSAYEVIINALAIGTGNPRAVYVAKSPSPPTQA
ncbi:clp1-like protein [Lentinula edodes]|uniref:Clp1-like protein n=1 Tax=Lentinula edodes TaxID=5353 RepID=A0A1Q3DZA7_LENED|nr:hypothetical protein F5877DRAFT_37100 [Lentinula edodes]GAW00241.1 clp1-like protein [Lentinula edodes]